MTKVQRHVLLPLLFLFVGTTSASTVNTIKVGGVFCSEENSKEETAFLLALDYINNSTSILPNTILEPLVNHTKWTDPFSNIEAVYWQIYTGALAIVGPTASDTIKETHPLCAGFRVPQLAPHATDPVFEFSPDTYPYLFRLSSNDAAENRVVADVISNFNWTRLAILTSRSSYGLNGMVILKDIILHKRWNLVAVESFREFRNTSRINATAQLLHIRSRGARIVVLNCISTYIRVIIRQARDLGMLKGWVWIVTSGAFTFDGILDADGSSPDYLRGLIGIRHSFGNGEMHQSFKALWERTAHGGLALENEASVGHTFDAVLVLADALNRMRIDGVLAKNFTGLKFGTYDNTPTKYRSDDKVLLEYLSKTNISGVMGRLAFDEVGSPLNNKFDIVNIRGYGYEKVGHWNEEEGLVMAREKEVIWPSGKTSIPSDSSKLLENQTVRIVVIEELPFVMKKTTHPGNVYEGFCIDLLNKLKETLKFDYEIYPVPDNNFGSFDHVSKEWNGMVRELLEGKADLAVASFTISSDRQKVIDFTQPYMDLGLTILIRSVTEHVADYFTFMKPFRSDLWLAIAGTTVSFGIALWFFSTFSPFGFYGRCVQIAHHKVPVEHIKRRHTLRFTNSLWSSIAYYVGQSADSLHPVSASGRITVAFYWFSLLIILSTYTASLAASLTIRRFTSPISSVEDLSRQNEIAYGTVRNSQPQTFFETSSIPSFITMWQYMKYHHTLLEGSAAGVQRVKKGGFAFIWDSVVLEHVIHSEGCGTLTTVGKLFGKIGYGIGLPKGSPYTTQLSNAILELRSKGYLEMIEKKWLHSHGQCPETHGLTGADGSQLGCAEMAGVFLVVAVGFSVSLVVLLLEWVIASKRDTTEDDPDAPETLKEALKTRLSKTWHDWRHREDVPSLPRFISDILKEQLIKLRTCSYRQNKVKTAHVVTEAFADEGSTCGEEDGGKSGDELEDGPWEQMEEEDIYFQPWNFLYIMHHGHGKTLKSSGLLVLFSNQWLSPLQSQLVGTKRLQLSVRMSDSQNPWSGNGYTSSS